MARSGLVSDKEAALEAGISPSTLRRFVEAGCLSVEAEEAGVLYFSRSELRQILGKGRPRPERKDDSVEEVAENIVVEKKQDERVNLTVINGAVEANSLATSSPTVEPTNPSEPSAASIESTIVGENVAPEQRTSELLKVIEFQDTLLNNRETELRELKEQRDWLKRRIEKLEEQCDQDRFLLLRETYMISHLLELQKPKKSLVRGVLEFLGMIERENSTVEVERQGTGSPDITLLPIKK